MLKDEWNRENLATVSCRVRKEKYNRLRAIAEAEEVSIHRILTNLIDKFMDEYEKGDQP